MANKKVSQLVSKPSVLVTDLFPIADSTTGQLFKTTISDLGTAIGSGVSSVNTLVGAVVLDTDDIQELVSPTNKWFTDTRARAALSASSPLAYNSGTGVFSIAQANGSTNGFLSSADWTTFNAKQAALSGTGFVKISGTTISYDNSTYLTTSAAALTYLALSGGTLTGTLNGTNITISNSLIAKGGTFNGGASAGVLTIDGLASDLLMNRSNTSNGASITLLTNAVEKWNIGLRSAGTTDNFFIYNSNLLANAVSINSSNSATTFASSVTASALYLTGMTAGSGALYYSSGGNRVTVANYNANGIVTFEVNGGNVALILNANLSATFASTLSATGATLSGALSGTSATFSSTLGATIGSFSNYISVGGTSGLNNYGTINIPTGEKMILNSYHGLELKTSGGIGSGTPISVFNVSSAGAATFSGNVFVPYISSSGDLESGSDGKGLLLSKINVGPKYAIRSLSAQLLINDSSSGFNEVLFYTTATERMRITSGGSVLLGTTDSNGLEKMFSINSTNNAGYKISVNGSVRGYVFADASTYYIESANSTRIRVWVNSANGVYMDAGGIAWIANSDERMKTDLVPILDAANKVASLRSVIGRYKTDEEGTKRAFLIAQDVQKVLPEAVNVDKETGNLGVSYSEVIPLLVASIKELKAELDTLKNK